jgi:chromosome segregation ATPase
MALSLDLEMVGIPARPVAEAFAKLVDERDRLQRELSIAAGHGDIAGATQRLRTLLEESEREREAVRRRLEDVERAENEFRTNQEKLRESERLDFEERESIMGDVSVAFEGLRAERATLVDRTARLECELEEMREIGSRQAVQIAMLERARNRLHDGTKRAMAERVALREEVSSARSELAAARARIEELESGRSVKEDGVAVATVRDTIEKFVAMKAEHQRACELLEISTEALHRSKGVGVELGHALAILQARLVELENKQRPAHGDLSAQFAQTLELRERRVRTLEDILGRLVREFTLSIQVETRVIEASSAEILGSKLFKVRTFLLQRAASFKRSRRRKLAEKRKRNGTRIRHLHSA